MMANWTAEVTRKFRDTSNFNIVAEITYTDGVTTIVERYAAVDLTDAQIAEQARKRVRNVLEVGDTVLATLSVGPVTLPADPVTDPKQLALFKAQHALQVAARDAQIKALNDPTATDALAALKTAEADAAVKV